MIPVKIQFGKYLNQTLAQLNLPNYRVSKTHIDLNDGTFTLVVQIVYDAKKEKDPLTRTFEVEKTRSETEGLNTAAEEALAFLTKHHNVEIHDFTFLKREAINRKIVELYDEIQSEKKQKLLEVSNVVNRQCDVLENILKDIKNQVQEVAEIRGLLNSNKLVRM